MSQGKGKKKNKKNKKSKPHHSCVIQLPPRTFIPVGIYSCVGDEFNLRGNGRDKGWHPRGAAVTWGHSTGSQGVKILLLEVTREREGTKDTQWTWPESRDKTQKSRGCRRQRGAMGRRRGQGCQCHFQLLVLISRTQRLVKIMSDLCQILLQIKT